MYGQREERRLQWSICKSIINKERCFTHKKQPEWKKVVRRKRNIKESPNSRRWNGRSEDGGGQGRLLSSENIFDQRSHWRRCTDMDKCSWRQPSTSSQTLAIDRIFRKGGQIAYHASHWIINRRKESHLPPRIIPLRLRVQDDLTLRQIRLELDAVDSLPSTSRQPLPGVLARIPAHQRHPIAQTRRPTQVVNLILAPPARNGVSPRRLRGLVVGLREGSFLAARAVWIALGGFVH